MLAGKRSDLWKNHVRKRSLTIVFCFPELVTISDHFEATADKWSLTQFMNRQISKNVQRHFGGQSLKCRFGQRVLCRIDRPLARPGDTRWSTMILSIHRLWFLEAKKTLHRFAHSCVWDWRGQQTNASCTWSCFLRTSGAMTPMTKWQINMFFSWGKSSKASLRSKTLDINVVSIDDRFRGAFCHVISSPIQHSIETQKTEHFPCLCPTLGSVRCSEWERTEQRAHHDGCHFVYFCGGLLRVVWWLLWKPKDLLWKLQSRKLVAHNLVAISARSTKHAWYVIQSCFSSEAIVS